MKKQVLVAGGGIGGLAAALAASRAGWEVRLYERAAAFSEVGAGVQLGPNVVRRLQAWGLQKPLQDVAAFPDRLQYNVTALPMRPFTAPTCTGCCSRQCRRGIPSSST